MPPRKRHPVRDRAVSGALALLATLFARLSWSASQRVGRGIGRLGSRLSRRDWRRGLAHLAFAFPELDPAARARLLRACFLHHGMSLAECLWLTSRGPADLAPHVAVLGWEHVEAAQGRGTPIVILTGHCGNWEVLAAVINGRGLNMRVAAREVDSAELNRWIVTLRSRFGTETIERGAAGAARKLLTTLREGGALGMLIDQDTRVEGVWVPFFGRPAYTPVGAAKIALKLGAAVVPAFIERRTDGSHLARFAPPLVLPADATAATAQMTAAIEAQVRAVPAQWVWWHKRWRRQPPPEPGC